MQRETGVFRLALLKNRMMIGNFIANFIGIHLISFISHKSLAPPTLYTMHLTRNVDWVYMPVSFFTIIIVTMIYEIPIRRVLNAKFLTKRPVKETLIKRARQRLLNEPFVLMTMNLVAWSLASIVYPLVFYLNHVDRTIIFRTVVQTTLTGIIITICAFFILEGILQNRMVPIFFPSGGLYATPKTIRIRIRTRLAALLFACNFVPSIAIVIIVSVSYTMEDKSPEVILELLRPAFIYNSLIFILLGIFLTYLVGRNMTLPFTEIIEVLKKVRKGNLDEKVRVTTNDEIGYTGDVVNEMTDGLKEREALRHSLELAREVQQNLLPQSFPSLSTMDIAGRSIYCDQTGGDYFDFLELDRSRWGILVGDVSDHGVPSALLMATARAFLRLRSSMPGSISQVITDVNRQLTRDVGDSARFMTLFYLVLDQTKKNLQWVRAGHDPGIIYDAALDTFEELYGRGIALGVDEDHIYEENEKDGLVGGQVIILATDGLWEARNSSGEIFGKTPLYQIIRNNKDAGAAEIVEKVFTALERFQQGRRSEDDRTLIVVKIPYS